MAGQAMNRGARGFGGMHAKQTHRRPGFGNPHPRPEPPEQPQLQTTEHAHPTRYETPQVDNRKQKYLNEKVADIQASGQAGVMHKRPRTPVSNMTISNFASGSTGGGGTGAGPSAGGGASSGKDARGAITFEQSNNQYENSEDYFGHEDYEANKRKGFSNKEIKDFLTRNPHLLRGDNRIGKGNLYDKIGSGGAWGTLDDPPSKPAGGSQSGPMPGRNAARPQMSGMDYVKGEQSGSQYAGESGLGGTAWASAWKNENARTRTDGVGFGLSTAQKFINQGAENQVVNREVLQKGLDQLPLYHQAKSTVQQHMNYGDIWNKDYKRPEWNHPTGLKPVDKPDLSGSQWIDQIKDVEL